MHTRLIGLAAALVLSASSGAMAQSVDNPGKNTAVLDTVSPSDAARSVGKWVYDPQGNVIGSVRGLTDGGRTASIMVGAYFQPGSRQVSIPARALSVTDGKVSIDSETAQVLGLRAKG